MSSDAVLRSSLAKDYGFDVNMNDSDLTISSAASKSFQRQCSFIYHEFMENMKTHLRQENEIKQCLQQLQKERVRNMKYSLYRSAGDDLFTTSKKRRQKMIENLSIVSPLLFDDSHAHTPWGLDPIIDEDEEPSQRPHTAPSTKVSDLTLKKFAMNIDESKQHQSIISHTDVPDTIEITPAKENITTQVAEKSSPTRTMNETSNNTSILNKKGFKSHDHVRFTIEPPTPVSKTEKFLIPMADSPVIQTNVSSDLLEEAHGEVDLRTEHTRARKITIKPEMFAKLSTGPIKAKLVPKDGEFLIKPVIINYTPTDVDAVFLAKDPTKEKMALVRQITSCLSGTVAADLKINNRIAIMKSLIGKETKKTSVSEIFDKANDRKTKHFRIIKEGAAMDTKGSKRRVSTIATMAKAVQRMKAMKLATSRKHNSSSIEQENTSPINRPPSTPLPPRKPLLNHSSFVKTTKTFNPYDEGVIFNTNENERRDIVEKQDPDMRPRTSSFGARPLFCNRLSVENTNETKSRPSSHNGHYLGDALNRSAFGIAEYSSVNMENSDGRVSSRNGGNSNPIVFNLQGTDVDMTQMIKNLVEGKGGETFITFPPHERPCSNLSMASRTSHMKKMNISKRGATPSNYSDNMSELSFGFDRPPSRSINKRDTIAIVKQQMKEDKEYQESMSKMRSRLSGSKKILTRRSSIKL